MSISMRTVGLVAFVTFLPLVSEAQISCQKLFNGAERRVKLTQAEIVPPTLVETQDFDLSRATSRSDFSVNLGDVVAKPSDWNMFGFFDSITGEQKFKIQLGRNENLDRLYADPQTGLIYLVTKKVTSRDPRGLWERFTDGLGGKSIDDLYYGFNEPPRVFSVSVKIYVIDGELESPLILKYESPTVKSSAVLTQFYLTRNNFLFLKTSAGNFLFK